MEGFWAVAIIYGIFRNEFRKYKERKQEEDVYEYENYYIRRPASVPKPVEKTPAQIRQEKEEKQREQDIKDLRKQGYTDELIAVILPTIRNGQ